MTEPEKKIHKTYAAIGPNQITNEQGVLVEQVTSILASQGYTLRSIGGDGFDTHAFLGTTSASGKYLVTLPWIHFSGMAESDPEKEEEVKRIIAVNHLPQYANAFKAVQNAFPGMCKTAGEDLMAAAHLMSLLGRDLNTPARFLLTTDKGTRNTSRVITMAKEFDIPVVNLLDPSATDYLERLVTDAA